MTLFNGENINFCVLLDPDVDSDYRSGCKLAKLEAGSEYFFLSDSIHTYVPVVPIHLFEPLCNPYLDHCAVCNPYLDQCAIPIWTTVQSLSGPLCDAYPS